MRYWFCVASCGQLIPLRRASENRAARWLGETHQRSGSTKVAMTQQRYFACIQEWSSSAEASSMPSGCARSWLNKMLQESRLYLWAWKDCLKVTATFEIEKLNKTAANAGKHMRETNDLHQCDTASWPTAGHLYVCNAQVGLCTASSPWTLCVRRETKHQSDMPEVKVQSATEYVWWRAKSWKSSMQLQYMESADRSDWFCAQALSAPSLAAWPRGSLSSRTHGTSHSLVPNCLRIKTSRFFPSTRQPRCLAKPASRKSHRQKGLRHLSATRLCCQVTQSSSWCPGPEKFARCCRWYSGNHATLWDQKGMFPQDDFQCFYIQTQFESTPLFQTQGHKWLRGDCLGCGTEVGRDDVVWKDFLKSAS